ncbi:phosphate acyltransferase [Lacunimicrobium album]
MRIALDAMGGDAAPGINLEGAIAAVNQDERLHVCLVGEAPLLKDLLSQAGYHGTQIEVVPADGFVGMDEKPTDALRNKPDCSLLVCWKLMAGKQVDAVVSAGHTGAVVVAGLKTRLFLNGVKRPGIAVTLPTLRGKAILLDVGANPAARPEHLAQYGVMGEIYAREILGIAKPRVGIINIGSEEGKGTEIILEAHQFLSKSVIKDQYIGNVEGRGIFQGDADVIICDGFTGNVVLKAIEGMGEMMMHMVKSQVIEKLDQEKDLGKKALGDLARNFQYSETGGALLLGIDGICLIAHGSSSGTAIRNALQTANRFAEKNINGSIVTALAASSF